MYAIYVTDGSTEMQITCADIHEAAEKLEDLACKFPGYTIAMRQLNA